MFSKNKNQQSQSNDNLRSGSMKSPNETFAILAPNLVVSGNLVSEGNIHIDGTVEGDVQTVELTIGGTGIVKGRVFGKEVKVSGRVVGSVTACELILEESAVIEGDIHYQALSVSRGARLNGNCSFSETELDITVLSNKKTRSKAGALAFGDAAMKAVGEQSEASESKSVAASEKSKTA
jgi:cytoskeletal protein CcmA (bactofilin family)